MQYLLFTATGLRKLNWPCFNWVFCTITNYIASKQPFPSRAMFYNQMMMMKVWQTYRLLSHYQRKSENIFTVWICVHFLLPGERLLNFRKQRQLECKGKEKSRNLSCKQCQCFQVPGIYSMFTNHLATQ